MSDSDFRVEVVGYSPPPPSIYHDVFVADPSGVRVLEHLMAIFYDRQPYVAGGPEGARETERRAAHREVIAFIHRQIAKSRVGT